MTRIRVARLVWDNWNTEHIKKHHVEPEEIEKAIRNLSFHKQTYDRRYLLVGRSGKRILAIVLKKQARNTYYVVTARDADKKERRKLYGREKNKQNTQI